MGQDNWRQQADGRSRQLFTYLAELQRLQSKVVLEARHYQQVIWLTDVPDDDDPAFGKDQHHG